MSQEPISTEARWGSYAPSRWLLSLRSTAMGLGPSKPGRMLRSLIAKLGGAKRNQPIDLQVFGSQRARLYPSQNLSEKRVHAGDRWWETAERAFLAQQMRSRDGEFVFLDVGANAGLYALAIRSEAHQAGRAFRAAIVEPQPIMLDRIAFNLAASEFTESEAEVFPWAITGKAGMLRLALSDTNFGEAALQDDGGLEVEGHTLLELVEALGAAHVDCLKIDIEGHEDAALAPFFESAPRALWPQTILIEARKGEDDPAALARCVDAGYRIAGRSRMNAFLTLAV